ncbi:integrin alpha pat-2 [Aphelenchoides avenae]|nr:integrin alpha pat-2 [Aphelenchus avenae]
MVSYLHILALVSFAVFALADKDPDKVPLPPAFLDGAYVERRAGRGQLKPAIDTTLPTTFDSELIVEKDCGEDNVCTPDLQVHAEPTEEKFTVGTTDQTMVMNVTVRNRGEDSYLTQYRMEIPPGFEYSGIENYETKVQALASRH